MFDWKNNQVFFSAETQGSSSAQEQQAKKASLITAILLWPFFQFYGEKLRSASQVLPLIFPSLFISAISHCKAEKYPWQRRVFFHVNAD